MFMLSGGGGSSEARQGPIEIGNRFEKNLILG